MRKRLKRFLVLRSVHFIPDTRKRQVMRFSWNVFFYNDFRKVISVTKKTNMFFRKEEKEEEEDDDDDNDVE